MNNYLCIDNFNDMLALTVGKVYTSIKETNNLVWVINDLGYEDGYARNIYFRKVEFIDSDNKNFQVKDAEIGELLAYLSKNKED